MLLIATGLWYIVCDYIVNIVILNSTINYTGFTFTESNTSLTLRDAAPPTSPTSQLTASEYHRDVTHANLMRLASNSSNRHLPAGAAATAAAPVRTAGRSTSCSHKDDDEMWADLTDD